MTQTRLSRSQRWHFFYPINNFETQFQYFLSFARVHWARVGNGLGLALLVAAVVLSGGTARAAAVSTGAEPLLTQALAGMTVDAPPKAKFLLVGLDGPEGQFLLVAPGGDGQTLQTQLLTREGVLAAMEQLTGESAPALGGIQQVNHELAAYRPGTAPATLGPVVALGMADEDEDEAHEEDEEEGEGLFDEVQISGYGAMTYSLYDWQTDTTRRNAFDVERLVVEPEFHLKNGLKLEAELEIEHGGTGSTMEFDKFEEFGEYEQEIEKGGEIVLEKLVLEKEIRPAFNWRIGHLVVPAGLLSKRHKPAQYFTVRRSEAESEVIPSIWHESGVELFGHLGSWHYQGMVVTGLDSTGFSSANWIQRGHQQRFETANANDLALAGRVDYHLENGEGAFGLFGYIGDTGDNRPKADFSLAGTVKLFDLHGHYEHKGFKARGMYLYGTVDHSAAITNANKNLSNFLNVKRTPVGSAAEAFFLEAGYDVLPHWRPGAEGKRALDLFLRYDFYDTMKEVETTIIDNSRWERTVWTYGLNYHLGSGSVFKLDHSLRELGNGLDENTFSLGFGFQY